MPPSIAELRKRLVGRGTDSAEVIEKRMASAQEEISHALEANYLVVNDDFETATADLLAISRARRLQMDVQAARQVKLLEGLLNTAG